jgi:predicted Fe-Mo cluster-binding NifX family protein
MKVIVSAAGPYLTSAVDARFGRAPWFVVVDTESGEHEALDNGAAADAASGAGVMAAQRVVAHDPRAVLTGHCGPNSFRVLSAAGIEVMLGVTGTVESAVESYRNGDCAAAGEPDVAGHSGTPGQRGGGRGGR